MLTLSSSPAMLAYKRCDPKASCLKHRKHFPVERVVSKLWEFLGKSRGSSLMLNVAEAMLMVTMTKHQVWDPGPEPGAAVAPPALPWSCRDSLEN